MRDWWERSIQQEDRDALEEFFQVEDLPPRNIIPVVRKPKKQTKLKNWTRTKAPVQETIPEGWKLKEDPEDIEKEIVPEGENANL